MKRIVTEAIVLGRINFGEADRILTVITPTQGKLRLMAKGVRKSTSKMAGGIELFSVSSLTYIPGKRDIGTLVSSRLTTHFANIVTDLGRTTAAYEIIKITNDSTEDECEPEFYQLLVAALDALNDVVAADIVETWFLLRLLKLQGHEPNLLTDANGAELTAGQKYSFDFGTMAFSVTASGRFSDKHIKMMRLTLVHPPTKLNQVQDAAKICHELKPLIVSMRSQQM